MDTPKDVICKLEIGIAKSGPYFLLKNESEEPVTLTIWPHHVEPVWRVMCEQLGIPYVNPKWDELETSS